METPQNYLKSYLYLVCIKAELWIRNPFLSDINYIEDVDLVKDELVDLTIKNLLQLKLNLKSLGEFWCSLRKPILVS
jgi:hypothetical protein